MTSLTALLDAGCAVELHLSHRSKIFAVMSLKRATLISNERARITWYCKDVYPDMPLGDLLCRTLNWACNRCIECRSFLDVGQIRLDVESCLINWEKSHLEDYVFRMLFVASPTLDPVGFLTSCCKGGWWWW